MKSRSNHVLLSVLTLFAGLASTALFAQSDQLNQGAASAQRKQFEIPRTELTPVLDGILDDEIWQQAAVISDFHQTTPVDQGEPSEQSVFYVAYSEDYFYIAARLYDSVPEDIRATVLIQDTPLIPDDRVAVILDTFNNSRTGFRFESNPNGIRGDGVYENPGSINWNWSGIWQAESQIDGEGWTTEMAIPFTTLNFDPNTEAWGFSLSRVLRRTNETIAWTSFNRNTNPSTTGLITGIRDINQGVGLDIVPSVTLARSEDYIGDSSESRFDPSLDVFYKFTPNLTGALTINTDFSATEADNRQVNLTRFSLFFPEKRDFFLQDSEIFTFGGLTGTGRGSNSNGIPFYSRRVGLDPATGQPVDIDVGGKLTGRVGDISIGTLLVQQGDRPGLDGQDIFVGRITSNVLSESKIGAIVTAGDPNSETDSTLAGVDFAYRNTRFSDTHTLTGDFWYEQTDTDGVVGDDKAFNLESQLSTQGTGFSGSIRYSYFGEQFDPAMGFANRTGIEEVGGYISGRYYLRNHPLIRNYFGFLRFSHSRKLDTGELQSEELNWRIMTLAAHSGDQFELHVKREREGLEVPFRIRPGIIIPAGKYSFETYQITLNTTDRRNFSPDISYSQGDFYNGDRRIASLGINWTPNRNLTADFNYSFNDIKMPEGNFISRLIRMNLNYAFNARWSWVNLMQYDNGSNSVGLNSRLHWAPQAGEDLYVVLNYNMDSLDGAFRGLESRDSELVLKYTRNFRF